MSESKAAGQGQKFMLCQHPDAQEVMRLMGVDARLYRKVVITIEVGKQVQLEVTSKVPVDDVSPYARMSHNDT